MDDISDSIDPVHITNILDLHGFFPEQIEEIVNDFLENASCLNLKQVRIVHGKGKSRLKYEVIKVLKHHPLVESFGDAAPFLGGWGATIVNIKKASS